jgi:hypothetical protein
VIMTEDGPRIIDSCIARPADAGALTSTGVVIGSFDETVRLWTFRDVADAFEKVLTALACEK